MSTKGRQATMDPTTAYRLAQIRMHELQAEASAQRLAAEVGRSSRGGRLGRGALIVAALRSLAARLRDVPRLAATEPDMPYR
jgi:hypothetical protein